MAVIKFNVRAFTRQEPDVWQCQCGSYTFWLYSSGSAHCSECRDEAATMRGYWQITKKVDSESTAEIIRLWADSSESSVNGTKSA